MNITQRFTLMMKGRINGLFDRLEDPERSLNQLILDMEEQLDGVKRAAAQAMANEDRLRSKIALQKKDVDVWQAAARRALQKGAEDDARQALKRAELATRQAERLGERLVAQEKDTTEIRSSAERLSEQVEQAKERLALLQAQLRQRAARRAMGRVSQGVSTVDLYGELERMSDRVEQSIAADRAYFRLDAEMRGENLKERLTASEVEDAVDERLAALRTSVASEETAVENAGEETEG